MEGILFQFSKIKPNQYLSISIKAVSGAYTIALAAKHYSVPVCRKFDVGNKFFYNGFFCSLLYALECSS